MGILDFGKNKEVPTELPDLISDEIEKESLGEINKLKTEEASSVPENNTVPNNTQVKKSISDYRVGSQEINAVLEGVEGKEIIEKEKTAPQGNETLLSDTQKKTKPIIPRYVSEKSFFDDLQQNIEKEILDINSLEEWHESKFSSRDMLGDMRSYWEKKKTPSIMEALGKNFQAKISEKIGELQDLERDWQNIYFGLIEKEEEIKDSEKELKKILNEFVKICRHKKESLEEANKNETEKKEE